MTTNIHQSNALVNYIEGKHIKDFQVLIDDPEVYYSLPGKIERLGVKTISSWPIFVTVILNEGQNKKVTSPVSGGPS